MLLIDATPTTPLVKVNADECIIQLTGRSSPENSLQFYYPLMDKIKTLFADCTETIQVNFSFQYFNTSSSKCLFDFFKMLRNFIKEGKDVEINWHYEEYDDDMLETGEDYAELLGLEFNFVEVEDIEIPVLATV
ncbi:MAG: DUF1987 domain-containing protein [Cyclobacteriaceae bacterium]